MDAVNEPASPPDLVTDIIEEPAEPVSEQGGPTKTKDLRQEAAELRQCFTRYAFQAIGLCSLAFAGIVQLMLKQPVASLLAGGLLPIIFAVCRLGTYKYQNSNRESGYELYLERTRNVPPEFRGRWKPEYRNLSWEEALHAWRAVQPSLFEAIYLKRPIRPDRFRPGLKLKASRPVWFLAELEVEAGTRAKWFPGSYLTNLVIFLYGMAVAAIAILFLGAGQYLLPEFISTANARPEPLLLAEPKTLFGVTFPTGFWACMALGCMATAAGIIRFLNDFRRCRNVRVELQSIPSCARIWQAVVIAHYEAVEKSRRYRLSNAQLVDIVGKLPRRERNDARCGNAEKYVAEAQHKRSFEFSPDGLGLMGYSFWLGQEAASLAADPLDLEGWIANRRQPAP